jgi:hypothetical protein
MSYSQLMSQMSLDPGAGTSGTQYDASRASSYDTPGPSTRVSQTQDTIALAVKFDRKTHTVCLSFGGYFVSVDIFFLLFFI